MLGVGLMEARFEPPLLIADAVMQGVIATLELATLWTFSMRLAASGALLLSKTDGLIWLRPHCRIKDWRYSQAAGEVCDFMAELRLL